MTEIDWQKVKLSWEEVEEFRKGVPPNQLDYKVIDPLGVIITRETDDKQVLASLPYTNGFCMHPNKCAGLRSCPRNYACSE
jgi:hypothetical protein